MAKIIDFGNTCGNICLINGHLFLSAKENTGIIASAVSEIDADHRTHILESMKIASFVLNEAVTMDNYR